MFPHILHVILIAILFLSGYAEDFLCVSFGGIALNGSPHFGQAKSTMLSITINLYAI
jgi:hypothetical protein